jgi:alpha-glucosidase
VQSESADPGSIVSWHRKLIEMRRVNPALRDGNGIMLDRENANVLSYARVAGDGRAILVSLNMSATSQTLYLNAAGVKGSAVTTLMASPAWMSNPGSTRHITLPPFAAWVASVD